MITDLYIVRHGIAVEPGTPGIPDDERPLTPKGEKRMRQIARGLSELNLKLDRILTSPLPRAQKTAEIIADELKAEELLETANELKAGTSAESIAHWLDGRSEQTLMIVGHNPTLSDLLSLLVLGTTQTMICDLKKGGIAALTKSSPENERYEVAWLAPPRLLRGLTDD